MLQELIIRTIEQASVLREPFTLLQFEPFMAPDEYVGLLRAIPEPTFFTELRHPDAIRPDGTSSRRVFELSATNLRRLPVDSRKPWEQVGEVLHSTALRRAIFAKLAPEIAQSRGVSINEAATLVAYPRCGLTEDSEGFRIGAHPDWHTKLVTVQFYLAKDLDQQGLGTHFYDGPELPFLTTAYRPNSGYAFVVDKHTWHARSELPAMTRKRYTLALTYFLEPPAAYAAEEYRD